MRKINIIKNLLKHKDFTTKIRIFFSTKETSDDFEPYEENYSFTNLNPITIKGYVSEISAESLTWRKFGLSELGAKEIICESKYTNYFKICNKIEIDDDTYEVYKSGTGGRVSIQSRPFNLLRVFITKKEGN